MAGTIKKQYFADGADVTAPSDIALDLANATGVLGISHGGHGQTTANPAFNALSPLTTKGDILAFSTVNARLPVGTNGQIIVADSGQTLGVKWDTIASGVLVEYLYNSSTSTTANDTTSFASGSGGAIIQNITAALVRRVRASTTITDRDLFFLEFNEGNGWNTLTSYYSGSQNYCNYTNQGGVLYGMGGLGQNTSTDVNVYFGQYAYPNAGSYGSAGSAWSANGGSSTTWRVKRVSL